MRCAPCSAPRVCPCVCLCVCVGHIMSSNQLAAEVAQRRLCCEWAGWHRVEWPTRSGSEKPENFSNFAGNMKPLKLQLQTKCEMETGNILTAPKTHTHTHSRTHRVNLLAMCCPAKVVLESVKINCERAGVANWFACCASVGSNPPQK